MLSLKVIFSMFRTNEPYAKLPVRSCIFEPSTVPTRLAGVLTIISFDHILPNNVAESPRIVASRSMFSKRRSSASRGSVWAKTEVDYKSARKRTRIVFFILFILCVRTLYQIMP